MPRILSPLDVRILTAIHLQDAIEKILGRINLSMTDLLTIQRTSLVLMKSGTSCGTFKLCFTDAGRRHIVIIFSFLVS